jgi:pyrimidine operon attenuation protein/uracil phosphoribosyltransferase
LPSACAALSHSTRNSSASTPAAPGSPSASRRWSTATIPSASFYRDDFSRKGLKPEVKRTELPFEVEGATIVLVDDVLYTGRSVRAAINELFDFGRPARVELAVLVDRGGRELPIEPTYAGARLAVARDLSIVLSRAEDGRLALTTEAGGA